MKTKSGIKIWYSAEHNELILSWHVYGVVGLDTEHPNIEAVVYQYVGEACENSNGITYIMPEVFLDSFEFIGSL